MAVDLDALARAAADGDRDALSRLVAEVQHPLYRLALRFLGDPEDAADATQEVLVLVVTRLGQFEGRSAFMTWAYAIATRQLLRTRRRRIESSVAGAAPFAAFLDAGLAGGRDVTVDEAEARLLCGEVRIACTYGMLLCLSRPLRAAYLLGDVLGMPDRVGAEILEITPAAFRKRVSRAHAIVASVVADRCGLIRAENPCRCRRQLGPSIDAGILDPRRPLFAHHPRADGGGPIGAETVERAARQLDAALALGEVYRADPAFAAPEAVLAGLRRACPDLL